MSGSILGTGNEKKCQKQRGATQRIIRDWKTMKEIDTGSFCSMMHTFLSKTGMCECFSTTSQHSNGMIDSELVLSE